MRSASATDMRRVRKILNAIEMFGNKSIRDISNISAKIFFDEAESLKFAQAFSFETGHFWPV